MNKETFFEKFSKIYKYPYGTGFTPDKEDYSDFERYLKRKQYFNPFHVDCPKTNKLICYCSEYKLDSNLVGPFKDVVFRLQNYYEGFDDQKEKKMQRKLEFEKERFMNVTHPEFTHTYDRYLQYLDEADILEYETQLKAERKQCVYCHKFFYGNPMAKLNANAGKDQPLLCEQCCKKYISGLFDSGSENKKIARFLAHPLVVKSRIGINASNNSNRDSVSAERNFNDAHSASSKRSGSRGTSSKGNKRQKIKEEDEGNTLKCQVCKTEFNYDPAKQTFNYKLVTEKGFVCIACKSCVKCKRSDRESELIICDHCDNTYHSSCLEPPLKTIPATSWFCPDCDHCYSCKTKLRSDSKSKVFDKFRVCSKCYELYKENKYCKICMCTYDENDTTQDFICCDKCEYWMHASCDGISKQKLKEMEDNKVGYICPPCKNQR